MSHLDAELVDELDGERCVLTRHDHLPLRKVDHAADVTRASEQLGAVPLLFRQQVVGERRSLVAVWVDYEYSVRADNEWLS